MTTFRQGALAAALAAATFTLPASADDRQHKFRTELSGFNEVHFAGGVLSGAISTGARGRFRADIDERTQAIDYELSYEGLEAAVAQAHIHFGQKHTVGAIVAWLCQGTVRVPDTAPEVVRTMTPECPQSGAVTGTLRPGMVLPAGQGFETTDDLFRELIRAMRAGATYANVHSAKFGPGEIRGQLEGRGRGHDHD
jgi:hypothetical protein